MTAQHAEASGSTVVIKEAPVATAGLPQAKNNLDVLVGRLGHRWNRSNPLHQPILILLTDHHPYFKI
ncbi:hypothetical protein PCANC_02217 [Puccinia coronata f. sp. avenae]|uniref:Uncharacterized protein n=1 Tax=Puccinia coronata f. sp. avenae TaxID=200324 RepID=A0A2N5W0X6_9BASI|nr:hypothetical protein PCANC_02217 [Puccinia coronata f. sp. avenae]